MFLKYLTSWDDIKIYTTITTQPDESKGIWLGSTEHKESNIEEQNFEENVLR